MPFDYYQRLSRRDRAIYRRSDAVSEIPLPDGPALAERVTALRRALEADARPAVQATAQALVRALLRQLEAPPAKVRALARRPSSATSELHGLYIRPELQTPTIQVWMRTAAHENVVAFRTFLRTLLHEVGHHLDYTILALEDSFHTEGFFRRESSLMRQLAPPPPPRRTRAPASERPRRGPRRSEQLGLPLGEPEVPPE